MDNTAIFTNKSELYTLYRPSYSQQFITEMVKRGILASGKMIADIGAGTGILTRQLCETGAKLIAIEPNDRMRNQAEMNLSENDVTILKGTAEDIPLSDNCLDAVFVGQAFHWFDPVLFKKECQRVLKQNGYAVLVWNKKVPTDMEMDRKKVVNRYHHAIDSFHCSWDERNEGIGKFFDHKYCSMSFSHNFIETAEEFIGRTLSASHALEKNDPEYPNYLSDWKAFFQKYQQNGRITIFNETICFFGTLNKKE